MAKFVKVHANDEEFLLNIENVNYIVRHGQRCAFYGNGLMMDLDESYDKIKTLIGAAQRGYPHGAGEDVRWSIVD